MEPGLVSKRAERVLHEINVPYLVGAKREALAQLLARLEAEHGDAIRRVILFGSQARGDADAESDIDLLIVIRGGIEELRAMKKWCLENRSNWISEIIYAEEMYQDSQRIKPPLYVSIRRDGVELWDPDAHAIEEHTVPLNFVEGEFRMLDYETIMAIRPYLHDMREDLEQATLLENAGYIRGAMSHTYYAAFYVTTVALYLLNIVRGKHSGIAGAVSQFLVKPGFLDEDYQKIFVDLQEGRLDADYGATRQQQGKRIMSEDEMRQLLRDGKRYIERMKQFVIERGVDKTDFDA